MWYSLVNADLAQACFAIFLLAPEPSYFSPSTCTVIINLDWVIKWIHQEGKIKRHNILKGMGQCNMGYRIYLLVVGVSPSSVHSYLSPVLNSLSIITGFLSAQAL